MYALYIDSSFVEELIFLHRPCTTMGVRQTRTNVARGVCLYLPCMKRTWCVTKSESPLKGRSGLSVAIAGLYLHCSLKIASKILGRWFEMCEHFIETFEGCQGGVFYRKKRMVSRERLELSSSCEGQLLRLECLPISPPRQERSKSTLFQID